VFICLLLLTILFVFTEMIIGEYGASVWKNIEHYAGLETSEWKDSEFYPDEAFFDMVNMVVSLPEMNSEKVTHTHTCCVDFFLLLQWNICYNLLFYRSCICMQATF
jgi:hypothetical protein